jgi:hypothetical protein
MEVSGQLHAPAALFPGKEPLVPFGEEACDTIRDEKEIWKHKGRDDVVSTAEVTQRRMRWRDDHE